MICVDVAGVGMSQPDKVLFADVDLTVTSGDRLAVVGVNGSGKTTLLRILTGALTPDRGTIRFGRGVRIATLDQDAVLPDGTAREAIGDGWEVAAAATSLGVLDLFDRPTSELSGGQAKRVALAAVLATEADLVVLDEPTNHLDLEAVEWLEQRLIAMRAALVIVTHDRHTLDRVTSAVGPSRVVELAGGAAFVHHAAAGSSAYATYLDARAERLEHAAAAEATRKVLARQELAWLRRGAPARSSKPKARLRTARAIVDGGPGPAGVRDHDLELGVGTTRLGNQVIELDDVTQGFGELTVIHGVDLTIEPGARLAVVGPNGSGKSTLLDIIGGRREPRSGVVRRGSTVVVGFADQHAATLDPDTVVLELVSGPHREPDFRDRALLERFWFDSTAQHAPVRMLSGGERRRLQLVMVLAARPNVLILDEPTNDLDLDTLRALESFLDDWPGAAIVASHDRAFLDRVADHVLAIDPGGAVRRVPGGVAGWLDERRRRPERASAGPAAGTTSTRPPRRSATSGPSPSTIARQLREAERKMTASHQRVEELTAKLAGTTDHVELGTLGIELAAAQRELDEHESTWLDLAAADESNRQRG